MDIPVLIFKSFFKAFGLFFQLALISTDLAAADIRHALMHQGISSDFATIIVGMIPVLTLIAAVRLFAGYLRLAVSALMVTAFGEVMVPFVAAHLH